MLSGAQRTIALDKTRTSSSLERARFLAEVGWLSSARFCNDMFAERLASKQAADAKHLPTSKA